RGIARNALEVDIGQYAGKYHFVPGPAYGEGFHMGRAHFNRMIDQRIIIGRFVRAESVRQVRVPTTARQRQASVNAPVAGAGAGRDGHLAWLLLASMYLQKNAGAVEKTVGLVQVRTAYRQIPGINPIAE